MRLLIVDDDPASGEVMAELLRRADRSARQIEKVSLAGDLDTAIGLLPEHDAVLCDGLFPISPNSWYVEEKWEVVQREACARGAHFVLYSGCPRSLSRAESLDILGLCKPAPIQEIYEMLMSTHAEIVAHPAWP